VLTQPDDALTTSREHRDRHIGRVDVLDKVKALIYLPGGTEVTTEMAAAYFEVEIETIKKLTQRSADELEADGYRVIEGHELRDMKSLSGIGGRSRSLALFPKRAMLRMSMLLRDSVIARAARDEILNKVEQAIVRDLSTTDGQIAHLRQMLEMAEHNKALEIENTTQRAALEAAAPKVAYVDQFIRNNDSCTLRVFAKQIGVKENRLRHHLISRRVIYRQVIGQRFSKSKQTWVDEYLYQPYATHTAWFTVGDQPNAPRLFNGQMRTTLYITPPGKVGIARLLDRHPIVAIEGASA
jgi:regulator of replication initiation timing